MKEKKNFTFHRTIAFTVIKYAFSLFLTLWAFKNTGSTFYFLSGILELVFILVLSNLLMKNRLIGNFVNSLLLFFYNAQMIVFRFGSTYITTVMLTNLRSVNALSGKAVLYITAAILCVFFSVLPIHKIHIKKSHAAVLFAALLCSETAFLAFAGTSYSPMYGYCNLLIQSYKNKQFRDSLSQITSETLSLDFYNTEVTNYRVKNRELDKQPNIILVFTEGLSQSVVSDERNLMPNVAAYQERSLNFVNYYNHTFATYRGLIGQLYSGYQLGDWDSNALISLQGILSDQGYHTAFLNTEPHNPDFLNYLESFDFNEIIGDTDTPCNGHSKSISDKDAYELLLTSAEELDKEEAPFFLAMYSFGTHVSFDSTDEVFGDGEDAELNKFYNLDHQFGAFMEKFLQSPISNNTIFVFTADHATYVDDSFKIAFPDTPRPITALDEIPLFIYYKGMQPECIDAKGRNSLCLAPTILDYIDLSAPNCFLGTSLFANEAISIFETSFTDTNAFCSTKGDEIHAVEGEDLEHFSSMLQEYFALKNLAEESQIFHEAA